MARYDRDTIDDGSFISSLGALDILVGVKKAETVVPATPTVDVSDKKLQQQAATVPQAAVANTSFSTPMTISGQTDGVAATRFQSPVEKALGRDIGSSVNYAANVDAQVAAAQDATPKPKMSQEQIDGGGVVKWIGSTNGKWEIVMPIGSPLVGSKGISGDGSLSTIDATGDYAKVNGVLNFKGTPFTGNYKGYNYVDGRINGTNISSNIGYSSENGVLNFNGKPFTGTFNNVKYINGISSDGTKSLNITPTSGSNYGGSGSTTDPFTVDSKPYTGTMFGSTYNNGVLVDTAAKTADDIAKQGRLDARTEFSNTLKALGLPQNLVDELDNMIKQDYTKSQMYLELQKTPAWKERFPGMESLAKAGKAVDAGQYISMEKGFLQTLDYYGIDKKIFGTTAELGKQIGNLVSPKAFEDRVALAAQDVEANPDVLAQLNLYFGVDKSAAISYLLNPEIGLDIIKRQARAAEIGAKAAASKFDFGQTREGAGVAESFINAAGTMDLQSLDVAFQQSRQLAGNQGKLAQIEGADYNDLQAVSAILGKDQAAILDSQRRAAREAARFGGGSGLGSGSLKRETTI